MNKSQDIEIIGGVECYESDGVAYLKLETAARGLGFTRTAASGNVVVRWDRVDGYLDEFGVPTCGHDGYIPENIFYRLAMKAKNDTAEKFQAKVADEIIPSIRKTGGYGQSDAVDISGLSQEMQMMKLLADNMIQTALEQQKQSERITKIEQAQQAICEAVKPVTDNWRVGINKKFNRIQKATGADFGNLRVEMYAELQRRAGCNLTVRAQNLADRMMKRGASKTEIKKITKMDVIESDKKLREIFSMIVTEYEIKYCMEVR